MKMSLDQAKPPAPARKPPLICGFIRLTGLLLAVMALAGFFVSLSLVPEWFQGSFKFSMLLPILGLFLSTVLFIMGYRMVRQISHVTVANFACIYSILLTGLFIYFLTEGMVRSIGEAIGMKGSQWDWFYHPDLPLFRIVLVLIAFLIFHYGIKHLFIWLLKLESPPPKPGK